MNTLRQHGWCTNGCWGLREVWLQVTLTRVDEVMANPFPWSEGWLWCQMEPAGWGRALGFPVRECWIGLCASLMSQSSCALDCVCLVVENPPFWSLLRMLSTWTQQMFAELDGLDELALIRWLKLPQDYKSAISECLPKISQLDPFPLLQFSHLGICLPFPERSIEPHI